MSRRNVILASLSLAAIVVGVVGLAGLGSGGGPSGEASTSTTEAAAPPPTTAPLTTVPSTTASPSTSASVVEIGAHPVCAAWDAHLVALAAIDPNENEVGRLTAPLDEAFYREAADALDGDVAAAVERIADHHVEHIEFWSGWDWDYDAYLTETVFSPDAELIEQPWPSSADLQVWRGWLTERCGIEFAAEITGG